MEIFKKNVPQSLASPLNHGPADRLIEVRVQDEARIGQKTGRVRIRARKGTRPRWLADQRYRSACLFGAVCADRETGAALMLPWCHGGGHWNKELASQGDISRPVAKGAQAAVLMDRAPGHTSGEVKGPETLTLIFLPARSPELDRVEKVWQSLRENRLMKEPTAIKSGASREWTQNGQT